MSAIPGSSEPLIFWAVLTALYIALRQRAVPFSYQTVMCPVRMVSIVTLKKVQRIQGPRAKFLKSPRVKEALLQRLNNRFRLRSAAPPLIVMGMHLKLRRCPVSNSEGCSNCTVSVYCTAPKQVGASTIWSCEYQTCQTASLKGCCHCEFRSGELKNLLKSFFSKLLNLVEGLITMWCACPARGYNVWAKARPQRH